MRYVGLGRDSLRSHFVFRPRHAPEWLRARFLPVVFLANEEELTGKTFTTSLNTTNPNIYVKFIFLRTSPLIPLSYQQPDIMCILHEHTCIVVWYGCDLLMHYATVFLLMFILQDIAARNIMVDSNSVCKVKKKSRIGLFFQKKKKKKKKKRHYHWSFFFLIVC